MTLDEITRGASPSPVLWIDARPDAAYRREHIPGALALNEGAWEELLPAVVQAWRPGTRIVVYCDSPACGASQAVAARIERELKFPDLYVLKGGWTAWAQNHR